MADITEKITPEAMLQRLRSANVGFAITIWKDGTWKAWQTLDAKYAEADQNWFFTITSKDIEECFLMGKADDGNKH